MTTEEIDQFCKEVYKEAPLAHILNVHTGKSDNFIFVETEIEDDKYVDIIRLRISRDPDAISLYTESWDDDAYFDSPKQFTPELFERVSDMR